MEKLHHPPILKNGQETEIRIHSGVLGFVFGNLECRATATKTIPSCKVFIFLNGKELGTISYLKHSTDYPNIFFVDSPANNSGLFKAPVGSALIAKLKLNIDSKDIDKFKEYEFILEAIPQQLLLN